MQHASSGSKVLRPFEKGKRAFWNGQIGNPYPADSVEHREWQYGFDRAYFNNLQMREAASGKTRSSSEFGRGSKKVYQKGSAEEIN